MMHKRIGVSSIARMLLLLLLFNSMPLTAFAAQSLNQWLDSEVSPWLGEQLATHPRFKGQALRVVVMREAEPEPSPDGLSLWVVERISERLAAVPGIHLLAAPADTARGYDGSDRLDCRPSPARYLVALESQPRASGVRIQLRILDLDDRSWVPGFARTWNGELDASQRRRAAERHPQEALRGQRDLPFAAAQPDLLASRIAAELACALRAHPAENLKARIVPDVDDPLAAATAELVANHLIRAGSLRQAQGSAPANVLIASETHQLETGLRQLWVSVRPAEPDQELPSVAAAAYVTVAQVTPVPAAPTMLAGPADKMMPELRQPSVQVSGYTQDTAHAAAAMRIEPLRLLRMEKTCQPGRCTGSAEQLNPDDVDLLDPRLVVELASDSGNESDIYLLALRSGRGLVRMTPAGCSVSAAIRMSPGQRLRHPLFASDTGLGDAEKLTVFAVAFDADQGPARVRELIRDLPSDCSGRALNGAALERWNRSLSRATANAKQTFQWRGLRLDFGSGETHVARR
ncbi:MAG: hypothetical protein WBO15_00350 [Gammaproteobacteria bacterium]